MVWDHKGQQQGASFSILIYLVVVDPPTRILAEGEVLGSFKGLKGGRGSVLFSSFHLHFSFPLLDNLAGLELLTVLLVFEVISGLKISSGKLLLCDHFWTPFLLLLLLLAGYKIRILPLILVL